jgi:RNA polymerase sigma factor for flagellar operon FliA
LDWVPRSVHEKARKVETAMRAVEQRTCKVPSDVEVAREMKISISDYQHLLDEIRPATFVCLDSVRNGESDDQPSQYESVPDPSQIDPSDSASRRELARLIAERLEKLPEMQRKVLALYYFEDLRLREIAEIFGVTESRICQIHSQAIMAVRAYLKKHESEPA